MCDTKNISGLADKDVLHGEYFWNVFNRGGKLYLWGEQSEQHHHLYHQMRLNLTDP